jgi:integrase
MANSTVKPKKGKPAKPSKPYEGFPLYAHAAGVWAKKIRGKTYYFSVWADPAAALEQLNREYPYLKEGREPPAVDISDGCKLRQLCNEFLNSKRAKLNNNELSPRTFRDYYRTCEVLVDHFGKDRRVDDLGPKDFESFRAKLAKRLGVVSLKNEITRCRTVFHYADVSDLIEKPVSFGQGFDRPSAKIIRREKNKAGPKVYSREEVKSILGEADTAVRAMCLLGLNCGFGNTDVATLPQRAVDLKTGWVDFPRVKTEIPRRIPLWPETVEAVKKAIAVRPKAKDPADGRLCFLTKYGHPWVRVKTTAKTEGDVLVPIDGISGEFKKILRKLSINGRKGLGFYTFRHCFETQAGEAKDQVATDAIMGHVDPSMGANYRHGVSDERLRAVVDAVHDWLWPAEGGAK